MNKETTIKELLKFSTLELAELLYEANKEFNNTTEALRLKEIELSSQRSFTSKIESESQGVIEEYKSKLQKTNDVLGQLITSSDAEISRLKGKMKEALTFIKEKRRDTPGLGALEMILGKFEENGIVNNI
jgi:hypothetical protein